jgi:hypothetical protein
MKKLKGRLKKIKFDKAIQIKFSFKYEKEEMVQKTDFNKISSNLNKAHISKPESIKTHHPIFGS